MKKLILNISLIFLLTGIFNQLLAQDDDYSKEKDLPGKPMIEKKNKSSDNPNAGKYVFGGGLGLQFGNPTSIELSPKLGYKLTQKALVGGGITYIYYSENSPVTGNFKTSIYGGSLFASYEPIENLFGWVENELLSFESYNLNNVLTRKWIDSPFIGIGYRQPIGEKGFFQIMLLYNLNYNTDSPYSSPYIPRISFFF